MMSSLLTGVAFAALIFAGRKKVNLSLACKVTVPLFVVAFMLLPVLCMGQQPIVLYSIMTAGYGLFDVIIWCLIAETAYNNRVSGFVLRSIVRGVALLARLAGTLAGYMYVLIPNRPPSIITVISVVALYFVGTWVTTAVLRRASPSEQFLSLVHEAVATAKSAAALENNAGTDEKETVEKGFEQR